MGGIVLKCLKTARHFWKRGRGKGDSMQHADFYIGLEFMTETGRWRCTDVGTRVVVAIKLDGDPRNWAGPPYSIVETVFDEYDFGGLWVDGDR